jgi:anti-anti-sigma factor
MEQTKPKPTGVTVVSLQGEFDVAHRERLAEAFDIAAACPVVIVDFAKTAFIDSTVLGELVRLRNVLPERAGTLILTEIGKSVRRLFDVSQLGALFAMRPTLSGALAAVALTPDDTCRLTLIGDEP